MIPISLIAGGLAQSNQIEIWHIGLVAFLSGSIWALDMPVRRPLMGEIVGEARLGTAMGLDALSYNASHMLGPVAGGALLSVLGLGGAYFLSAGFYAMAVVAMVLLKHKDSVSQSNRRGLLREFAEGFVYLRVNRPMASIMGVTVVFNLWAYPMITMVPVIGKDILRLDAFSVGLLASVEGVGALIGTLAVALWARTVDFMRLFSLGTFLYIVAVILFGWSSWVWISAVVLIVAGLGAAAFGVMQSALVLLNAPLALRGHMMGVLTVCIGLGPIGFLHIGWLADWIGAAEALMLVGVEGLLGFALCWWLWPELKSDQRVHSSAESSPDGTVP